jgi:hypothetical protein
VFFGEWLNLRCVTFVGITRWSLPVSAIVAAERVGGRAHDRPYASVGLIAFA